MSGYEYDYRSPVHRALSGGADRWMDKPRQKDVKPNVPPHMEPSATGSVLVGDRCDKPQSGPDEPENGRSEV